MLSDFLSPNNILEIDDYFEKNMIDSIDSINFPMLYGDKENDIDNFSYFNIGKDNLGTYNYSDELLEEGWENKRPKNDNNEVEHPKNDLISKNIKFLSKKMNLNKEDNLAFKINRNYLNNYLFKVSNNKFDINDINSETSSSNHRETKITLLNNNRCDSLLIMFKSHLGKSFIKHINSKLKKLCKRKIKFFAFNYKNFTLKVSYTKNKTWLGEKMKDLLVLGDEPNQEKNKKALRSLFKRKEEHFNEIKELLNLSYREIIERFYASKYFEDFKNDEKVYKKDENFVRTMGESILATNGFINFLEKRKGNKEKEGNFIDEFN